MKLLNGAELAEFIKERQARQVRALRQAHKILPKLAIISCGENPTIDTYVKLKKVYGEDILIEVVQYKITQSEVKERIKELNIDDTVHGIIVQLPFPDPSQTDAIVDMIAKQKDVDALRKQSMFDAATPLAINWLLSGYNITLQGKNIVIVGHGRLVGEPLLKMLQNSGLEPKVVDENTKKPKEIFANADIIITAVGKAGLVTANMIPLDCVVVDAGTTSENGVLKGDLADDVYERQDLTLTPRRGGVGPLTVSALFDNVIRAAEATKH
jgi:methylenetetrahydrofolate dehydrogenase (NADP+)/methenyltetrahydrofolate cyclohydrolase